jgi:type I restriction enzyme, R subunit
MSTEAQIEQSLLQKLAELKYTLRSDIRNREALERNFREKFQALNRCTLSDAEFARFRDEIITPDVFAAAKRLRENNTFTREDGTPLQYSLVNIKDWCKNDFEVVSQLRMNTENSHHRYDVVLLLNGLPLVQIELKTYEVSPRNAMQQIVDYKNDPGNGYTNSLMCFVQLFIASNRSNTYYFANNQKQHFNFNADEQFLPVYRFASEDNKKITHLDEFAEKFLSKCTLAELISRYMVLIATEQKILVMRPYQIYAVKAIMDCIQQNRGNGYIWHTTGSGKTLTSFKASTLLKDNPDIHKCLFVVDRKDLDRQTRDEFNRFQKDCVEENTNTGTLVSRLLSDDYANKVIVTTIQKLGLALDENSKRNKQKTDKGETTYKELLQPLREKRIAIIFDECHRSQFGDNHEAIKNFFPKAQLFGFTGTPIFESNATYKQVDGTEGSFRTTQDIFQKQLHAYTITNAIDDKNVLRFHIDYFKGEQKLDPASRQHKLAVVKAILNKHDAATNQRRFNAVFATASINDAIEYYELFKQKQAEKRKNDPEYAALNIACVFSPPAEGDKDVQQLQEDLQQEKEDNKVAPDEKKKALSAIIADYNQQYDTNHRISDFDVYYKDVQQRIKFQKYSNADHHHKHKIDITIVVDMLLTGFDSPYLNTLYVDKNLKYHGLIQAFSRTNRVLNDTKPYGNILDFRQQENEVDKAIMLFSGENAELVKEIWLVEPAPKVIERFEKAVTDLQTFMIQSGLSNEPQEVYNLRGDTARIEFVNRFKEVQRLKTQLDQYTDLTEEQQDRLEGIMPEQTLRAYRSSYLETAKAFKAMQQKEGNNAPTEVQELDFELVLFASALVDYDYIMGLIAKYTHTKPAQQKMSRSQLISLLSSSSNLMDEKDDITDYINSLEAGKGLTETEIRNGYQTFKAEKNAKALAAIAQKHGLETSALDVFVQNILNRMIFDGEQLSDLLAPLELGWKVRAQKETELMADLAPFLTKLAAGSDISGLSAYEEGK